MSYIDRLAESVEHASATALASWRSMLLRVVGGLAAGACVLWLAMTCGAGVYVLALAISVAVWQAHTAESQELATIFELALRRAGLWDKEAAADLGVTPSNLSEQLSGQKHLSLWRAASLPDAFWVEFALAVLKVRGRGLFHVLESGALMELVGAVREMAAVRQTKEAA